MGQAVSSLPSAHKQNRENPIHFIIRKREESKRDEEKERERRNDLVDGTSMDGDVYVILSGALSEHRCFGKWKLSEKSIFSRKKKNE